MLALQAALDGVCSGLLLGVQDDWNFSRQISVQFFFRTKTTADQWSWLVAVCLNASLGGAPKGGQFLRSVCLAAHFVSAMCVVLRGCSGIAYTRYN